MVSILVGDKRGAMRQPPGAAAVGRAVLPLLDAEGSGGIARLFSLDEQHLPDE
jgi:hypothetical protein